MTETTNRAGDTAGLRRDVKAGGSGLHAQYTPPRPRGQPVFTAQGRVVGRLSPDGWLEKHVDPARHKLRIPSGWATDVAHLQLAGLRGVRLFLPDRTVLTSTLEDWRCHAVPVRRSFGEQVCLPDGFWTVRRPSEPQGEQLALFGEAV